MAQGTIAEAEAEQRALAMKYGGVIFTSTGYMKYAGEPEVYEEPAPQEQKVSVTTTSTENMGTVKVTKNFKTEAEANKYVRMLNQQYSQNIIRQGVILASESQVIGKDNFIGNIEANVNALINPVSESDVMRTPSEQKVIQGERERVAFAYKYESPVTKPFVRLGTFLTPDSGDYLASIVAPNIVSRSAGKYEVEYKYQTTVKPFGKFTLESVSSLPGTIGVAGVIGYLPGAVIGETALVFPKFGNAIATVTKYIGKPLLAGGVAMEVVKIGSDVSSKLPAETVIGNVFRDVAFAGGFGYGFRGGIAEGLPFKYWGKEKIPQPRIMKPEVISGEQKLPYDWETPNQLVQEFKTGKYRLYQDYRISGWHVGARPEDIQYLGRSGNILVKGGEGKWASEVLYVSPSLSPHFLGYDFSFASFSSSAGALKPGGRAFAIQVEDVSRIPKEYRGSIDSMNMWLNTKASRTVAYVTPEFELGKWESEAGIPKGAFLTQVGGQGAYGFTKYSTWNGLRFPIYEYVAIPTGTATSGVTAGKLAEIGGSPIAFIRSGSIVQSISASSSVLIASGLIPSSSKSKPSSSSVISSPTSVISLSSKPSVSSPISSLTTSSISGLSRMSSPSKTLTSITSSVSSSPVLSSISSTSSPSKTSSPSFTSVPGTKLFPYSLKSKRRILPAFGIREKSKKKKGSRIPLPTADLLSIHESLTKTGKTTFSQVRSKAGVMDFQKRMRTQGVFMRFPTAELYKKSKRSLKI